MMYLPYREVKIFLKKISKFTNVIVAFREPGSKTNDTNLNLKNALIFKHNYLNLFKNTNFYYLKLFSNNGLHVAKNY